MFPESKLHAAAYLFESANGNALGPEELSEVIGAGLAGADASVVADEIRHALEHSPDIIASYRSTAFWALGKRFDLQLRGFFRRHLAAEIHRDMNVAYQVMIALDSLEEPVWPSELSSRSSEDRETNRQYALRYLDECGKPYAWRTIRSREVK